ncbi:hypothetical protein BJX99DRAFT_248150 [Aspergillus californicus]
MPEDELHIKYTPCLLCRQPPEVGAKILDSHDPLDVPTQDDLRRFSDATKPLSEDKRERCGEHESRQEGLFSKHTSSILQDSFSDFLKRLPLEIQIIIYDLAAPCWYIIVLGETQWLIEHLRENPRGPITYYQGVSYLSQISTTALESTQHTEVQYLELPAITHKIDLSIDSIGVREIQFVGINSHPKSDGSPWYRVLEPTESVEATVVLGFFFICCAGNQVIGIYGFLEHAGNSGEFVDRMNRSVYQTNKEWIYFPLNIQEHINGAWVRHYNISHAPLCKPAFVLHTSLGRPVTFGPHYPSHVLEIVEYYPLVRTGDGPVSGIIHDGLDPGLRSNSIVEVGVTRTGNDDSRASGSPPLPADFNSEPPAVPPGQGSPTCTWYISKAPLQNILKVQLCRDLEQSYLPILGLLVFCNDGHVESLGQMRWDLNVEEQVPAPLYLKTGSHDGKE